LVEVQVPLSGSLSGPLSGELQALQRSIDELRDAIAYLSRTHGESSVVARLRNDLDRLVLDAADAEQLITITSTGSGAVRGVGFVQVTPIQVSDEPYDPSLWGDDADDEGVGGYHGKSR
jgi:hypothetical protein